MFFSAYRIPCQLLHSKVALALILLIPLALFETGSLSAQDRARDHGIEIGVFQTGSKNAITDVPGISVGHVTIIEGDDIRTGVTAILPHQGNLFQSKVPAAIYVANGFGKLAGSTQVEELGTLETPIILTNTLSVSAGMEGVIKHVLSLEGNEPVRSVNAVVGETNDGRINNIRKMAVSSDHVIQAIKVATTDNAEEGNIGAGTGTVCFGLKGGIGTSSRVLGKNYGEYTVGVIVQSNFGGVLEVNGQHLGKSLKMVPFKTDDTDGSCMMVVATDAPITSRNLKRLAQRAMMGFARTGGTSSNGSGDYVIAFSTHEGLRYPYNSKELTVNSVELRNDAMTPLFQAVAEATEEAILNSMLVGEKMKGYDGKTYEKLDPTMLKSNRDKDH
jgi:D-aminopeptidase